MDILLVEDNQRISEFVLKGLTESGYSVALCEDGVSARSMLIEQNWDIIILDIMLPDIDGITLLQFARFKKITSPILVISALGELDDKVKGLDSGADDYLSKPFHFKELLARIQALVRRTKMNFDQTTHILECKGVKMNPEQHIVEKDGEEIKLTLLEFKLLKLLLENPDKVLSRTEIMNSVWGYNYDTNTNIVDVYISYLRNKLSPKMIETVKGMGYIIRTK